MKARTNVHLICKEMLRLRVTHDFLGSLPCLVYHKPDPGLLLDVVSNSLVLNSAKSTLVSGLLLLHCCHKNSI